jgi:hypothetical protein
MANQTHRWLDRDASRLLRRVRKDSLVVRSITVTRRGDITVATSEAPSDGTSATPNEWDETLNERDPT